MGQGLGHAPLDSFRPDTELLGDLRVRQPAEPRQHKDITEGLWQAEDDLLCVKLVGLSGEFEPRVQRLLVLRQTSCAFGQVGSPTGYAG